MMAATLDDIKRWLEEGKAVGATHVIIVCDTFDWEDYSVNVLPGEDVREKEKQYDNVNMQKIMEVYNMSMDIESQLKQSRARNY